jgi:hypothetical protein
MCYPENFGGTFNLRISADVKAGVDDALRNVIMVC